MSGNDIDMHLSMISKMFLFSESFDGFDDGLLQNGYHNNNAQNHSDFNVNEVCELWQKSSISSSTGRNSLLIFVKFLNCGMEWLLQLPASRTHPWQHGEHQVLQENRHLHNGINGDLSDR